MYSINKINQKESTSRLAVMDLQLLRIARGFTGKSQKQILAEALRFWLETQPDLQELIPSEYWNRDSDEPDAQAESISK